MDEITAATGTVNLQSTSESDLICATDVKNISVHNELACLRNMAMFLTQKFELGSSDTRQFNSSCTEISG